MVIVRIDLPHQLVRLLCMEQIYRSTIIKREAYHHE